MLRACKYKTRKVSLLEASEGSAGRTAALKQAASKNQRSFFYFYFWQSSVPSSVIGFIVILATAGSSGCFMPSARGSSSRSHRTHFTTSSCITLSDTSRVWWSGWEPPTNGWRWGRSRSRRPSVRWSGAIVRGNISGIKFHPDKELGSPLSLCQVASWCGCLTGNFKGCRQHVCTLLLWARREVTQSVQAASEGDFCTTRANQAICVPAEPSYSLGLLCFFGAVSSCWWVTE